MDRNQMDIATRQKRGIVLVSEWIKKILNYLVVVIIIACKCKYGNGFVRILYFKFLCVCFEF